jgi:hypothetical protein
LPKEAITGMADLNHWTAWAIDANTFRYHVEPHVMELTDVLTVGYLRAYLLNCGLPEDVANQWATRILFWHDPTELVTAPDQTATAITLHGLGVISNKALLRVAGFGEEDAPDADEYSAWLISKQRTWPANVSLEVLHGINPELAVPPITTPGTVPGIDPVKGVIIPIPPSTEPAAPAEATTPALPPGVGDAPAPPKADLPPGPPIPTTAAGTNRLAWSLLSMDRELRARLQVEANREMKRHLERLGTKLISKVSKNATLRKKIAMTHHEHIAMMLGDEVLASSGLLTATGGLNTDWADLKAKFMKLVSSTQAQSLAMVNRQGNLSDKQMSLAQSNNNDNISKGWDTLKLSLDALALTLIHNPDPNVSAEDMIASIDSDSLVPAGVVRSALSVAGGALISSLKDAVFNGATVPIAPSAGQPNGVALGSTIQDALTQSGSTITGYEWVHGPSDKVFDPHLDLDGQEFVTFTDDVLESDGGWPYVPYYYPGDHDGSVVAGTIIEGSTPTALSLRWYEGEIVEITTASGQFLSVTHNHPILTDRGWVDANALIEGDHVLRSLDTQRAARLIPDDYQVPTSVENLFASLWVRPSVIARSVPIASKDFHGDGEVGEIAVVATDSKLRSHDETKIIEPLSENQLTVADAIAKRLSSASRAFEGLVTIGSTTLGLESEGSEPTTLVRSATATEKELRLTTASWNHANTSEFLGDRVAVHAESIGQSLDALAGFVELDKVIDVNRVSGFKGHVFDLQTREHWYVANGILVHNCLCDAMPTLADSTD